MIKFSNPVILKLIQANRSRFNTCYNLLKHKNANLNDEAFFRLFIRIAERFFSLSVFDDSDSKRGDWLFLLFKKLFEFYTGNIQRTPAEEVELEELLIAYSSILKEEPDRGISALLNAVIRVERRIPDNSTAWIKEMIRIAPVVETLDELMKSGFILAWKNGMAEFRKTALTYLRSIRPRLAGQLFGIPDEWNEQEQQRQTDLLEKNPWYNPLTADSQVIVIRSEGRFSAFGGVFDEPPVIFLSEGIFFIQSGRRFFQLEADLFGSTLLEINEELFKKLKSKEKDHSVLKDALHLNGKLSSITLDHPYLFPVEQSLLYGHTILFNSKRSYQLVIIGINGTLP